MPAIDFILIGAMKSGTTTLIDYLRRHPQIAISGNKEIQYFSRDDKYLRGDAWYESHFSDIKQGQIRGEGSTCYSRLTKYPHSAERVHKYAPNVKLIFIVRDPAERAYSHFRHSVLAGELDQMSFRQALESQREIIETSKYMFQIDSYLKYFDVNQFFFMKFEDLINSDGNVFSRLFGFLGIDDVDVVRGEVIASNEAGTAQVRASMARLLGLGRYVPGISHFVKKKFSPAERKKMRLYIASKIANSTVGNVLAGNKVKEMPPMLDEDKDFITRTCMEDLMAFEAFSKLDLSSWYSTPH